MLKQRFASPGSGAFPVVVVGLVADEKDRKLAPTDELIEKAVCSRRRDFLPFRSLFDGSRNCQRANVAEVQVRRKAAGAIGFGVVAGLVVDGQVRPQKLTKTPNRGAGSASESVDGLHAAIEFREAGGDVLSEVVAARSRRLPAIRGTDRCGIDKEIGQLALEMRPEVMQ